MLEHATLEDGASLAALPDQPGQVDRRVDAHRGEPAGVVDGRVELVVGDVAELDVVSICMG